MKKLIILLLFFPLISFSQDTIPATKILTQKEAYMKKMYGLKKDYNTKDRYVIYPTENIYTSLLLDTQTGRIWQIQIRSANSDSMKSVLSDLYYYFDEEESKREYETDLQAWKDNPDDNFKPDVKLYKELVGKIGQFKLYPTDNMYSFIMVNTETGSTYQVQWSIDKDKRFVEIIF